MYNIYYNGYNDCVYCIIECRCTNYQYVKSDFWMHIFSTMYASDLDVLHIMPALDAQSALHDRMTQAVAHIMFIVTKMCQVLC